MLHLFLFVAALFIQALVEVPVQVPAWRAFAAAGALVLGAHLVSGLLVRRLARAAAAQEAAADFAKLMRRQLRWRVGFWLALLAGHAALVFLGGWPGAAWERLEPGRLPFIDRALGILPFALACLAAWRQFHDLDSGALLAAGWESSADRRSIRYSRRRYLRYQLRQCAVPALPFLAFQGMNDIVQAREAFRSALWVYPVFQTLLVAGLVLLAVLLAPWMVRAMWPTRPLPEGPLRCLLESLSAVSEVKLRGIYLWDLGLNRPANACVTGVAGFHRMVLLSEGLVDRLDTEEVATVFAHEIAHAHLRHFVVLLLYALGFLLLLDPLERLLPAAWSAGGLAGLAAFWLFVFGLLSRRLEREADCYAASLIGSVPLFVRTLRKVGARPGPLRFAFRHFPLETRVDQLYRVATVPGEPRRLRRVGGAMRLAVVALFVAGLGVTIAGAVGQLGAPEHWRLYKRAELALIEGRWDAAVRDLEAALAGADPASARAYAELLARVKR